MDLIMSEEIKPDQDQLLNFLSGKRPLSLSSIRARLKGLGKRPSV
jgi:hypothetical protein